MPVLARLTAAWPGPILAAGSGPLYKGFSFWRGHDVPLDLCFAGAGLAARSDPDRRGSAGADSGRSAHAARGGIGADLTRRRARRVYGVGDGLRRGCVPDAHLGRRHDDRSDAATDARRQAGRESEVVAGWQVAGVHELPRRRSQSGVRERVYAEHSRRESLPSQECMSLAPIQRGGSRSTPNCPTANFQKHSKLSTLSPFGVGGWRLGVDTCQNKNLAPS